MVRYLSAVMLAMVWLAPASASAECYSVYDRKHELIFQSTESPVDLRGSITEAITKRFTADAHMVFTPLSSDCPPVDKTAASQPVPESANRFR